MQNIHVRGGLKMHKEISPNVVVTYHYEVVDGNVYMVSDDGDYYTARIKLYYCAAKSVITTPSKNTIVADGVDFTTISIQSKDWQGNVIGGIVELYVISNESGVYHDLGTITTSEDGTCSYNFSTVVSGVCDIMIFAPYYNTGETFITATV